MSSAVTGATLALAFFVTEWAFRLEFSASLPPGTGCAAQSPVRSSRTTKFLIVFIRIQSPFYGVEKNILPEGAGVRDRHSALQRILVQLADCADRVLQFLDDFLRQRCISEHTHLVLTFVQHPRKKITENLAFIGVTRLLRNQ